MNERKEHLRKRRMVGGGEGGRMGLCDAHRLEEHNSLLLLRHNQYVDYSSIFLGEICRHQKEEGERERGLIFLGAGDPLQKRNLSSIAKMARNGPYNVQIQIQTRDTKVSRVLVTTASVLNCQ